MTDWKILSAGGDGWIVIGEGSEKSAKTSFQWCTRKQEINLIEAGFTAEYLDTCPVIQVGKKRNETLDELK